MYKFFVSSDQIQNKHVKILGEDVKHISNVLRLQPLDKIIVCDRNLNKSYVAEIINMHKEYIECNIIDEIIETTEPNVNIDLFQGLPKSDKMEYIIQKTIEIESNLYDKIEYLSENVYDASISKIINACIDDLIEKENIKLYQKENDELFTKHSVLLRKNSLDNLYLLKEKYGISVYKLIHIAIKNVILELEEEGKL